MYITNIGDEVCYIVQIDTSREDVASKGIPLYPGGWMFLRLDIYLWH
jgi:hypothetical protein